MSIALAPSVIQSAQVDKPRSHPLPSPPCAAWWQVVVVPILKGDKEAPENDPIIAFMNLVVDDLRGSDIRVHIDDRPKMRPVRDTTNLA